jgi:hypothetical protein
MKLPEWWRRCIEVQGEHVEKLVFFEKYTIKNFLQKKKKRSVYIWTSLVPI